MLVTDQYTQKTEGIIALLKVVNTRDSYVRNLLQNIWQRIEEAFNHAQVLTPLPVFIALQNTIREADDELIDALARHNKFKAYMYQVTALQILDIQPRQHREKNDLEELNYLKILIVKYCSTFLPPNFIPVLAHYPLITTQSSFEQDLFVLKLNREIGESLLTTHSAFEEFGPPNPLPLLNFGESDSFLLDPPEPLN